jgi:translation initiation factor 2D
MTPGLANDPPFPSKAKRGALVAIASVETPEIPTVVGRCLIDVCALGNVRGSKGVAVQCLNWAGDEVWLWSEKGTGGIEAKDIDIEEWTIKESASDTTSANKENDEQNDLAQGVGKVNLGTVNKYAASDDDSRPFEVVEKEWTPKGNKITF